MNLAFLNDTLPIRIATFRFVENRSRNSFLHLPLPLFVLNVAFLPFQGCLMLIPFTGGQS